MSIDQLIEKESKQYKDRYTGNHATIKSETGYRRSSYGSAPCGNYSMDSIVEAYHEYKRSMVW